MQIWRLVAQPASAALLGRHLAAIARGVPGDAKARGENAPAEPPPHRRGIPVRPRPIPTAGEHALQKEIAAAAAGDSTRIFRPRYDYFIQIDTNLFFKHRPSCDLGRMMADSRAVLASVGVSDAAPGCTVGLRGAWIRWMDQKGLMPLGGASTMGDGIVGGLAVFKTSFFARP